jgi:Phage tail assembly chaperone protein, TAC
MGFCLGRLGWPPAAFWEATSHELAAALDALSPARGRDRRPDAARLARLLDSRARRSASIRQPVRNASR